MQLKWYLIVHDWLMLFEEKLKRLKKVLMMMIILRFGWTNCDEPNNESNKYIYIPWRHDSMLQRFFIQFKYCKHCCSKKIITRTIYFILIYSKYIIIDYAIYVLDKKTYTNNYC